MSEQPAEAPAAEAPAAPESGASTTLWADQDNGVLAADFANHLGQEAMPYAEVLNQRFGGQPVANLAKSYGEANKMISEGGRPTGYPPEDAPESEWQKWQSANGVPDTAGEYELFSHDARPEGLNDEAVAEFQKAFHANKVPPALAKRIADSYVKIEQEFARRAQDAFETQQHEAQQELQKDWGPEYEDRMKAIKGVVASQGLDPADPELFGNPKTVRFLGKIVGLLGEDTVASMREAAGATGAFARDGKYEAHRIMTDATHPDYDAYRRGEQGAAAKVARLLQGK